MEKQKKTGTNLIGYWTFVHCCRMKKWTYWFQFFKVKGSTILHILYYHSSGDYLEKIVIARGNGWQQWDSDFQTCPGSCIYELPETVMTCTRPGQVEARQNHSTELGNSHEVPCLAEELLMINSCVRGGDNFL